MEWRIIARRTGSLAFPLAGMWVRVVHSAVNAYSLGHNLALTRYLTHKGEEKCGRDSTDVAGRNSSKHSISIHFPSYLWYPAMRALTLPLVSLPLFCRLMLHADAHASEPWRLSAEPCAGSYCTRSSNNNNGERNLFLVRYDYKNKIRGANED